MGSVNKNQNGIRIQSKTAHFICLGNSRLSTEVTLFEVPIGEAVDLKKTIVNNKKKNILN